MKVTPYGSEMGRRDPSTRLGEASETLRAFGGRRPWDELDHGARLANGDRVRTDKGPPTHTSIRAAPEAPAPSETDPTGEEGEVPFLRARTTVPGPPSR